MTKKAGRERKGEDMIDRKARGNSMGDKERMEKERGSISDREG